MFPRKMRDELTGITLKPSPGSTGVFKRTCHPQSSDQFFNPISLSKVVLMNESALEIKKEDYFIIVNLLYFENEYI